ncbi:hypothetical protein TWF132_011822 [Orbilia oligospora]|nr:hypothetical protein TWF132_011822 [Orbilia oligospora]
MRAFAFVGADEQERLQRSVRKFSARTNTVKADPRIGLLAISWGIGYNPQNCAHAEEILRIQGSRSTNHWRGEHSNYDQGLGLGFRYDALKTNPFDTKMRTDSTLLFLPHYSRTFQPNFAAKLTQGI